MTFPRSLRRNASADQAFRPGCRQPRIACGPVCL